jgi:hypothetical protein
MYFVREVLSPEELMVCHQTIPPKSDDGFVVGMLDAEGGESKPE